jgi:hypothetical protein
MKNTLPFVFVTALVLTFTAALPRPAAAGPVIPPVPPVLQVPAGNTLYLKGQAFGTQDYICLPSGSEFAWTFFGPQATLFDNDERQIITHFLSPNPFEKDTPRATWQHSRDTSAVWAVARASVPSPGIVPAIPWLLLEVVGAENGPTGGRALTATTFIQRLNTVGGVAPSTGCSLPTDVGKKALVPYTTDYYFYKKAATRIATGRGAE